MIAGIGVAVEAIALCADGMADWAQAAPILRGTAPYCASPLALPPETRLSPAERRRATESGKLALAVGSAAVAQAGHDPASLRAVFASSGADGETIGAIMLALLSPDHEVSPTRFHNSVHNAPSGYWGIAVQSRAASSSLSGHDASFAAGLLEAAVQAVAEAAPVLLVAYDLPYPQPLHGARPIAGSFAVALVLRPLPALVGAMAELRIGLADAPAAAPSGCADAGLEALRAGNPAARSLPLLALLAACCPGAVRLEMAQAALEIVVRPC